MAGFIDVLNLHATEFPQREALLAPGQPSVNFAEIYRRLLNIGGALSNAGVVRDSVVAVVLPDGADLLSIILGVASVAICAPLNPGLRESEIESSLVELGASALVLDRRVNSVLAGVASKLSICVIDAERLLEAGDYSDPFQECQASNTALVIQTSATTGKSRLAPLTHANLSAMVANTRETLQLTAQDRFLSMMPLFHLQGLLSSLAQFSAGGSVVSTTGFDGGHFISWIEQFQPTWYTASPALHQAIVPLLETRQDVLDRFPLRFVRSIGAKLPQPLLAELERLLRVPALEGYGMTEAGMVTSNVPPPGRRKAGSVGQSGGIEVAIFDEKGESLPPGSEGEIAVRGEAVINGYHNNPEADRSAFREGWFLTGDVGYLDEEGFLFVTGRIKDIINRGGDKVLPGEIDEVLSAHPLVMAAVAFGIPHPTLGEDVAAAVVMVPGASVGEMEIRRFASARLAEFKVPRRIFFVDEIPKGPTGKARRSELSAKFAAAGRPHERQGDLLTGVERKLEAIWKRILRIDRIGVREDFFAAGGDSLTLTHLMAEMEFEFGVDWTLLDGSEFLMSPTIETLGRVVSNWTPSAEPGTRLPFVALQRSGSRIPFFCIPGADENPYYFMDLAKGLGEDQPFYALRDPRAQAHRGVYTVEEHAKHFAAAIRSIRASGPYVLGGHCYGGILAFEAARQLVALGEEVRLLALFEVPTPGYPKVIRHWKSYAGQSRRLIEAMAHGEYRASLADVRLHLQVLGGLLRRKTQAFARRELVEAGLKRIVEPNEQLDLRNTHAGRSYEPKKLACRVVQFIAAEEWHSTLVLDNPLLGWRDQVGAGFSVQTIPGRADAIFKPPNVRSLRPSYGTYWPE